MLDYDLTAVIPARLNSSRVNEKVFQKIDKNDTLLSRKITQLMKILPPDRIVVNTESEKIADHALKYKATVHWREPYFADSHKASFSELIMHVISQIQTEHIAWTPFVVPFFDSNEFKLSFENYKQNIILGRYDSLASVVEIKEYIWDENKALNYSADHKHTISQDLPKWHQITNGNYMAPKSVMEKNRYILGNEVFLDVRHPKCKIDIDTLTDLDFAKAYQNAFFRDELGV